MLSNVQTGDLVQLVIAQRSFTAIDPDLCIPVEVGPRDVLLVLRVLETGADNPVVRLVLMASSGLPFYTLRYRRDVVTLARFEDAEP